MRRLLLVLLLCSWTPAFAQEKAPRRIQAFLIPLDEGARMPTARAAQALESVLTRAPAYQVIDLGRAMTVESTAEQARHAAAGRALLAQAADAASVQQALHELNQGLPAISPHEYAEATLRLAVVRLRSGEVQAARPLFALAVRLDPRQELSADEPLFEEARAELAGAKRGSLEIEVRPAGARIFLDGEPREAPIEAPAGKHLLEVKRAGFYPHAELIELTPRRPVKASITLEATPAAIRLNQLIAGAVEEAGRGIAGGNLAALAREFSLDRVLVGSVRTQEDSRASAVLALVDAARRKVIGSRTLSAVADGTDADQLEASTQAAALELIAADEAEEAAVASAAPRKPLIPGAVPKAAPGAPGERRVLVPAEAAAPASTREVDEMKRKQAEERKRPGSLRAKTGTEEWDE